MAESQAAQIKIARLEERLAQAEKQREELEGRVKALEEHDANYSRIIAMSRFGGLLILGAGAFLAWLPGWVVELKRLFTGR
jgi:hypothetical protein